MMKTFGRAAILAVFTLLAAAPPVASVAQTAANQSATAPQSALPQAPPPTPAVRMLAIQWFGRFQTGQVDRSQLSDDLNQKLSDAIVQQLGDQLRPFGQPASVTYLGGRIVNGDNVYAYILNFKYSKVRELMAISPNGKINGLVFTLAK